MHVEQPCCLQADLRELQAGISNNAEGATLHPVVGTLHAPLAACRLTCWS